MSFLSYSYFDCKTSIELSQLFDFFIHMEIQGIHNGECPSNVFDEKHLRSPRCWAESTLRKEKRPASDRKRALDASAKLSGLVDQDEEVGIVAGASCLDGHDDSGLGIFEDVVGISLARILLLGIRPAGIGGDFGKLLGVVEGFLFPMAEGVGLEPSVHTRGAPAVGVPAIGGFVVGQDLVHVSTFNGKATMGTIDITNDYRTLFPTTQSIQEAIRYFYGFETSLTLLTPSESCWIDLWAPIAYRTSPTVNLVLYGYVVDANANPVEEYGKELLAFGWEVDTEGRYTKEDESIALLLSLDSNLFTIDLLDGR